MCSSGMRGRLTRSERRTGEKLNWHATSHSRYQREQRPAKPVLARERRAGGEAGRVQRISDVSELARHRGVCLTGGELGHPWEG